MNYQIFVQRSFFIQPTYYCTSAKNKAFYSTTFFICIIHFKHCLLYSLKDFNLPNQKRYTKNCKMKKLYPLAILLLTISLNISAQPFALATNNINGSPFSCTALEDLGIYKRLRVQATQNSSSATWEFPQLCSFPGDVWRPYTAGTAPVPFDVIIPPVPGTNAALYNSGNGGATGNLSPVTQNNYYTFNIQNISTPNSPFFCVLETSYLPIDLSTATVSQSPTADGVLFSDPVTVTINMPSAPAEQVYVRYTTDAFVNSTIVQASITGNTGTAVIPALPAGSNVKYYIYSSTKSKATIDGEVASFGQIVHDMSTLEFNTNISQNYSYTIASDNVFVSGASNLAFDAYYPALGDAFAAINAGTHIGAISIKIIGNTTETSTAVLNETGTGSADYTSVNIKPAGGSTKTIDGNINGPLIELNGADNVSMDGLNTGGNAITFSNSSTSNTATISTIYLHGGASNNLVNNISILGSGTNQTAGNVLFSTAGSSATNNDNIISNCIISAAGSNLPVNAVYASGDAVNIMAANSILSCTISDFYNADLPTAGILLANNNNNWTIKDNKIFQSVARTFTTGNTHYGIKIASGSLHSIENNTIGYANALSTGTFVINGNVDNRFVGIETATTNSNTVSIQGNKISGIELNTTSGADTTYGVLCGISVISGNANIGNVSPNIVGGNIGIDLLKSITSTNGAMNVGIHSSSINNINIQKNIIGGLSSEAINAITSTEMTGIFISINGAGVLTITDNSIGNATSNNLRSGIAGVTTASTKATGIHVYGRPTTSTISKNTIQQIAAFGSGPSGYARGIFTFNSVTSTVKFLVNNNIVKNIISNSTLPDLQNGRASALGINIGAGNNSIIEKNTVTDIANVNTATTGSFVAGISVANGTNAIIKGNYISKISNEGTSSSISSPSVAGGILIRSANSSIDLNNNMIALGTGQSANTAFIGINANHGFSPVCTDKIYYNSVSVEGSVTSGAQPSFAFLRGDFSNTERVAIMDLKNNIFSNTRSGGSGSHYAIGNSINAVATNNGWNAGASDYNDLYANAATIGWWNGSLNYAGWQTASAGDGNSLTINPPFINASNDLHLISNSILEGKGISIPTYSDDYDGDLRKNPPTIGCDEIPVILPVKIEYIKGTKQVTSHRIDWKINCTNTPSVTISLERSTNTAQFTETIYRITATALRCQQPFSYTALQPLPGTNYYRLKMTDVDGVVTYSSVVALLNKKSGYEIVYLAPSLIDKGATTLQVTSANKINLYITISDITGKQMLKKQYSLIAGSNQLVIDVAAFAGGVYNLTCFDGATQPQTIRFVKK